MKKGRDQTTLRLDQGPTEVLQKLSKADREQVKRLICHPECSAEIMIKDFPNLQVLVLPKSSSYKFSGCPTLSTVVMRSNFWHSATLNIPSDCPVHTVLIPVVPWGERYTLNGQHAHEFAKRTQMRCSKETFTKMQKGDISLIEVDPNIFDINLEALIDLPYLEQKVWLHAIKDYSENFIPSRLHCEDSYVKVMQTIRASIKSHPVASGFFSADAPFRHLEAELKEMEKKLEQARQESNQPSNFHGMLQKAYLNYVDGHGLAQRLAVINRTLRNTTKGKHLQKSELPSPKERRKSLPLTIVAKHDVGTMRYPGTGGPRLPSIEKTLKK